MLKKLGKSADPNLLAPPGILWQRLLNVQSSKIEIFVLQSEVNKLI